MVANKEPSQGDIEHNKAVVAHAERQRLVASFLAAAATGGEFRQGKSNAELEREDEELFAPV